MSEEDRMFKEAIRYAFLSDWIDEASKEDIITKLIENDERAKRVKELEEENKTIKEQIHYKEIEAANKDTLKPWRKR